LPLNVLLVTVSVPSLKMPPPYQAGAAGYRCQRSVDPVPFEIAPDAVGRVPLKMLLVTVSGIFVGDARGKVGSTIRDRHPADHHVRVVTHAEHAYGVVADDDRVRRTVAGDRQRAIVLQGR
jgi:hypothetical protein